MKKCEFEDERWLRAQALLYKSRFNPAMAQNFKRCANELHRLRARVARLEEVLQFVLDECDWEESANEGGGDNRIGPAIRRALEEK